MKLLFVGRVRIGATLPARAPCPTRVFAFEKEIRGFAENSGDNVIVSKPRTSLDVLVEAYIFYKLYSWDKGFGIW